ncbi:MAG: hypothetical protein WD690_18165 [Vicinamibacterales bacterium]
MREAHALLEEVPCDLCGGTGVEVLRAASQEPADPGVVFRASAGSPLTGRLVTCARCGLVFVSPRLPAGTIIESYAAGEDRLFVSQALARRRTFAGPLRRIEALTGGPGSVFDVGTAGGSFLAAARARGWQIDCCEPNAWLAAWGEREYGIAIRRGTFDEQDLPRRWPGFSAVHLYYFSTATLAEMLRKTGFELVRTRPHVARLELGCGLNRAGNVLGGLPRVLSRAAGALRIDRWQAPFWIGQTFAVARKR